MKPQDFMKWSDDRWGAKGRGIYILLSSPVLLYALYIIASVGHAATESSMKLLSIVMFLCFTHIIISGTHCVFVCFKTLQRATFDGNQWDVVLYFGKHLRFTKEEVSGVKPFEKKSPRVWASPLSIDKDRPNYVVKLVNGKLFYITGVLPDVNRLVGRLSCENTDTEAEMDVQHDHDTKWIDSRFGSEGRVMYFLALCWLAIPYVLYIAYLKLDMSDDSAMSLLFQFSVLYIVYLFISTGRSLLVYRKTLQRAEFDGSQWDVTFYFGTHLRFTGAEVLSVETLEKKWLRTWESLFSIDRVKPDYYVVKLASGKLFYIAGVLPDATRLAGMLSGKRA